MWELSKTLMLGTSKKRKKNPEDGGIVEGAAAVDLYLARGRELFSCC